MHNQKHLTTAMRAILVDWLVEVQENFELNHETLYLAVKLVDLYVSKKEIAKELLQLVGAAALFIASKFDVSSTSVTIDKICVSIACTYMQQSNSVQSDQCCLLSGSFRLQLPYS